MLSYSRAKGLFAGINLSGGSLNPDKSKNERAYGPIASARDIALGTTPVKVSAEARTFTKCARTRDSRDVGREVADGSLTRYRQQGARRSRALQSFF